MLTDKRRSDEVALDAEHEVGDLEIEPIIIARVLICVSRVKYLQDGRILPHRRC